MKKYLLISFALLALSWTGLRAGWDDGKWWIENDGNCDGTIEIGVLRFSGGNNISHNIYIQYRDKSQQWQTFVHVYHWVDGSNWYNYNSYSGLVSGRNYEPGNGNYYYYFKFRPPDYALFNQQIQFRVVHEASAGGVKFATAYKPTAPQNLQASRDICNSVNLTWTAPDNRGSITGNYYVYRNGSYIGYTPNLYYTDSYVTDGVEYDYTVKYYADCGNSGLLTTPIAGSSLPHLDAPSGLTVSDDDCTGKINLGWQYFGAESSGFEINRSTASNFSSISYIYPAATERTYTDTPPSKETTYYYRVRTKNSCGEYGAWSSTVSGKAPDVPTAPANVLVTQAGSSLVITWTHSAANETGYQVVRLNTVNGVTNTFDVAKALRTYTDSNIALCNTYQYEVFSVNACGETSGGTFSKRLNPDFANSFVPGSMKASKGYFPDKVRLTWTTPDANVLSFYRISRRDLLAGGTWELMDQPVNTATTWVDQTADAGVMYEYQIIGIGICEGGEAPTNSVTDIGFRTPSGVVTGNISFSLGVAVENASVLVENAEGLTGNSIQFAGNAYAEVQNDAQLNEQPLTVQIWARPGSLAGSFDLINKFNGTSGWRLYYNSGNGQTVFEVVTNTGIKQAGFAGALTTGTYTQLTGVYDGTNVKLYVDGVLNATTPAGPTRTTTTGSMVIGANYSKNGNYFTGYLDEVRVWKRALPEEEVLRDFGRILNGTETGLAGYWRLDEAVGSFAFDCTKEGTAYHELHATLTNTTWSTVIPASGQLGLKGITDADGNYIINNIRYTGIGNNFTLTPFLGQHQFTPSSRVLFIGEGSSVHNNQDFTDISAFAVTGTVKYENYDCYVKDVFVYIDGSLVIKAGKAVTTNAAGAFSIQVPIGEHIISVGMPGHTFVEETWPPGGGLYDFQESVPGIEFLDNTLVKVVGRVVGGPVEASKKPALGLSTNNIGQARIRFKSQLLDGCTTETIYTDGGTGEYEILLPPLKYTIDELVIPLNLGIDLGSQDILDLSDIKPFTQVADTVYKPGTTTISRIDTASYQVRRDFIYRVVPSVDLTNSDGSAFHGDDDAIFVSLAGDTTTIDLVAHPFAYPVISMNTSYRTVISVFEQYVNKDSGSDVFDQVPVTDAVIKVNNGLSKIEREQVFQMSSNDGRYQYVFSGGMPNPNSNDNYADYSYTKIIKVDVETGQGGSITTSWLPADPGPDGTMFFRAYVLGARPKGNNFSTAGPNVVDFILRDPPGSNSFAYLAKDSSYSTTQSWNSNFGETYSVATKIFLGAKFSIGGGILGPAIETEVENNIELGVKVNRNTLESGELVSSYTFNQRLQTSGEMDFVGAPGDLFVGQSKNIIYGLTDNLELLPDTITSTSVNPISPSNQGFRISLRSGVFVDPDGFSTMFVYSQLHIKVDVIPSLIRLRDAALDNSLKYDKVLTDIEDPRYGTNNDDPIWEGLVSSADPIKTEAADRFGPSYQFKATPEIDSVRWYNQQLRLWKNALARNEREKLEASPIKNVSFDAGSSIEESQTYGATSNHSEGWEVSIDESLGIQIAGKIGGLGAQDNYGLTFNQVEGKSTSTSSEQNTTIGYSLSDGETGDYFTVDIKKPRTATGLVFRTKGGQSSCPWEEKVVTEYYQPGVTLSEATLQREIPTIEIAPNNVYGIPEDEPAEFQLTLGNASASGDDYWYETRVVQSSNPNGAVIQIDGESANRAFEVKAGESIVKRLTVKKGSSAVNDYEDLMIIFQSLCQSDPTDYIPEISDTVIFSAHFVPTCTKIFVTSPADQWVANYSNHDTLPITIGGYNINQNGFEKFDIQYKPKTDSKWINLATYYKDTAGMNDPTALMIDPSQPVTTFLWILDEVIDGDYQIRGTTTCPLAGQISSVSGGIIDRINPHPFGSPQPADGVLQPNDEIMVQFNEKINGNLLTYSNFDLRGVLNGTPLSHGTSLFFDGTAENYLMVPEGVTLNDKSFTLEIWAKRTSMGEMTMVSQGPAASEGISIGFDAANRFVFTLSDQQLVSDQDFVQTDWHHWAVVYNQETMEAAIYRDGTLIKTGTFANPYTGTGRILLAKRTFSSAASFNGNMHEFRIWNTPRTQGKLVETMSVQLNGMEKGLVGNWRMDEAFGILTRDIVHNRNGSIFATWSISPSSMAFNFDGVDDYLELNSGYLAFTDEKDFTIEFWFKANSAANKTLFSNGKGDLSDGNELAWAIRTDVDGNIKVFNQNLTFLASGPQYWNNQWHHFSLVVSRTGNMQSFVDGDMQYTQTSSGWGQFGGGKIWVGARGWYNGSLQQHDEYFAGKMDEIRVWGLARKQDQIKRDMNHRLGGDEFGLLAYYPFEDYVNVAGVMVLQNALISKAIENPDLALAANGADYTVVTPNIKLKRPVQKVNFTWAFNNDKIIITPTDPSGLIENTIIDVTVKGVRDMNGNTMQSPATWSVYVDRNQVKWEDQKLKFEKILYDPLTFTANITNSGGTQQAFSIDNLPGWLTAYPQSGTLEPLSYQQIQFVVNTSVPLGNYSFDAYLHTNFNFDEKLLIDLRVYQPGPDWKVNPTDFEYTMSIMGLVSVDGIISNDAGDIVAAFVDGKCRGVANLKYIPQFDLYEVFLSVYSKVTTGEKINFMVWNASEGKIHTEVTPILDFEYNRVYGTPQVPITIYALNTFEQIIPLPNGWKWVSFNLSTPYLAEPDSILKHLTPNLNSMVKGQTVFDRYSDVTKWDGSLSQTGGFAHEEMYMFYHEQQDTIRYIGGKLDAQSVTMHLSAGWNWVGFTPDVPMTVDQALGFLNGTADDLIKSQYGFSTYVPGSGWIGNLAQMVPGEGYMMKMANSATFSYPRTTIFGMGAKSMLAYQSVDPDPVATAYPKTMSVIAEIETGESPVVSGSLVLEAWSGEFLRGTGQAVQDPGTGRWLHFLSVSGNDKAENMKYLARDSQTGVMYDITESLVYGPDQVAGNYKKPLELTLKGALNSGFGTGGEMAENPLGFSLYPNPFRDNLLIEYRIGASSQVLIEVFNSLGEKVEVLTDSKQLAGDHRINWNGRSATGNSLPGGIYYIRIVAGTETAHQSIVKIN